MGSENAADLPLDQDILEERFDKVVAKLPKFPADKSGADKALFEVIASNPQATRFTSWLSQHPDLQTLLRDDSNGEYTVFVPVDSAFASSDVDAILKDASKAGETLRMHISPHYVSVEGLVYMPNVPTLLNPPRANGPQIIRTRVSTTQYVLNKTAHLVDGNAAARNGVVHFIDQVLVLPPSVKHHIEHDPRFSTFNQAIDLTDLKNTITGPDVRGRTLFAPTNAAFDTLGRAALDFLFQMPEGNPYLETIIKFHASLNTTFYSNFIWPKNNGSNRQTSAQTPRRIKGRINQAIPSMLTDKEGKNVDIKYTIARFTGLIAMQINEEATVVEQDLIADDGVVQVIDRALIPRAEGESPKEGDLTVEELKRILGDAIS